MSTRRGTDWARLAGLAAIVLVTYVLWETPFTWPVRLFVVFVHECGHALAAILTGGEVLGIRFRENLSGDAMSRGGWPFVILSAGYLTSALFGAVLVLAADKPRGARQTLMALAALTAACGLAFARPLMGLALPFALLSAAAFWFAAQKGSETQVRWLLVYLASCSAMYALIDIKEDVLHLGNDGRVTDAVLLAERTGIPAIFWGVLWATIAIALMGVTLRRLLR